MLMFDYMYIIIREAQNDNEPRSYHVMPKKFRNFAISSSVEKS